MTSPLRIPACRMACLLLMAVSPLTWAVTAPEFDRYLGSYNPPEYIPIDVASDNNGDIYVPDIYHERLRKFNQAGDLLKEFPIEVNWVRGVAVDSTGYIYLLDAVPFDSSSVQKLDQNGNLIKQWTSEGAKGIGIDGNDRIYTAGGTAGTDRFSVFDTEGNKLMDGGLGVLKAPRDVGPSADGSKIYVADNGNSRIVQFDAAGNVVRTWGSCGTAPDQFNSVSAVSVDSSGNVFVTDRRNYKIKKFTAEGVFVAMVGDQGLGDALFEEPNGNGVDPFGNVWLATYHGHDIQKFDNDLNYLMKIEGYRSLPDEYAAVQGVGVDSQRNVYFADKWLQRITKYDRDGNLILQWGSRGQGPGPVFNFPRTVHVDANDKIYVSDDGYVRKFDTEGNFIAIYGQYKFIYGIATDATGNLLFLGRRPDHMITILDQNTGEETNFGSFGTGPGEFDTPKGMDVGPNNLLYVADSKNNRVQVFTLDGTYVTEWGSGGTGPGEFRWVTGLAIDDAGRVYVGDLWNPRVQIFESDGTYITEFGSSGTEPGQFGRVWDIATEGNEAVYVSDDARPSRQRFLVPEPAPEPPAPEPPAPEPPAPEPAPAPDEPITSETNIIPNQPVTGDTGGSSGALGPVWLFALSLLGIFRRKLSWRF